MKISFYSFGRSFRTNMALIRVEITTATTIYNWKGLTSITMKQAPVRITYIPLYKICIMYIIHLSDIAHNCDKYYNYKPKICVYRQQICAQSDSCRFGTRHNGLGAFGTVRPTIQTRQLRFWPEWRGYVNNNTFLIV